MSQFEINVVTGNIANAGTDANVYLTLYGSNSNSAEMYLDNPNRDDFEQGNNNSFVVNTGNIGNVQGLAIRHDNSGNRPGWFLDQVKVKKVGSNSSQVFNCDRWLAIDEDDRQIIRLLGVVPNNIPLRTYSKDRLAEGRWMETSVTLSRSSRRIDANTRIWTTNEFTGFRGGVVVLLVAENGDVVGASEIQSSGVDGVLMPGASSRRWQWNYRVNAEIASRTKSICIVHTPTPRGAREVLNDGAAIVEGVIKIAGKIGPVLALL